MRNFVKVFLLFILGVAFGRYFDKISLKLNEFVAFDGENRAIALGSDKVFPKSNSKDGIISSKSDVIISESEMNDAFPKLKKDDKSTILGMNEMFSKLGKADKETLVILNCENIVFTYLDAAFSKENKSLWSDFYKKRLDLDRKINEEIDQALFFAPKRIINMEHKQDFEKLRSRGVNIVFVYQIDENRIKFPDEEVIRSEISSMLKDVGLNLNENSSVKLLITNSKKISSDIAKAITDFAKSDITDNERKTNRKSNSIKKIILVHEGDLKLDNKQINIPTEEILVNFGFPKKDITKDQMKKQIEILGKIGEWMHDMRIREVTNCANDEELVYKLCKESIMDVCSCAEIIEEKIYEKIASIVTDKNVLENLEDIIDYFQEIHNRLPNIFHYAFRKYLWELCSALGIENEKAIEIFRKMRHFHFNEHEVQEHIHRVVKRLGCGIHWRDMAKYEFVREFLATGEKALGSNDSSRYKTYMKVMNIVFNRVSISMRHMMEDRKHEFIRILHENGIEDSKIMNIFNISEEKFKNIISTNSLKNEESDRKNIKKIEKSQKTT
ncbi:MAG: hypothetical protein J6S86_01220 [Alphaproteobacteria bacterium]|nr:hypothetical protein [Alphaproteobacteria bacterium]